MTETANRPLTVVVERDIAHPPEKIWRALTQPHLIEEWLMRSDFRPEVGHSFDLEADWGTVHCRVLSVDTGKTVSYSWDADGLESTVTWTLSPGAGGGTRLRMEQTGFRPDQPRFYGGAKAGWPRFIDALERVLARLD
jgi:uncharacterized protein YndB with AHSA1/START domain